jgi:hypothetical protein
VGVVTALRTRHSVRVRPGIHRSAVWSGPGTFRLDGVDHVFDVELRADEGGGERRLSGRIVHASRDSILQVAGPLLTCDIPGYPDPPARCLVHIDGTLSFLRSDVP